MPKFLLDANLSHKVARFLGRQCQLDVLSLHGQHLGELPDHEVIRLARTQGRVIITLDRDYAEYFSRTTHPNIGIIYLDLPNSLRYTPTINHILERFFRAQAATIDLEHSLVTIAESSITIVHRLS